MQKRETRTQGCWELAEICRLSIWTQSCWWNRVKASSVTSCKRCFRSKSCFRSSNLALDIERGQECEMGTSSLLLDACVCFACVLSSFSHVPHFVTIWTSIQGIFQARILEWVVIFYSRGSSQPRDQTRISYISCISRWVLYHWGFPGSSAGKESACNVGDLDLIPGLGGPPGAEKGYPL